MEILAKEGQVFVLKAKINSNFHHLVNVGLNVIQLDINDEVLHALLDGLSNLLRLSHIKVRALIGHLPFESLHI